MSSQEKIINERLSFSPLITVLGETASGKTSAAIEIAKRVNGEIICADSRTIYKKMDIGTAKPTMLEQKKIPHHLINLIEPDEVFSAAKFQQLAMKCIQEIHERGRIPILVGGTGLYIDAVLYNFHFGSEADAVFREQLEQMNDVELTTLMNTRNINTGNLNTKNRRHVIRAIERNGEVQNDKILRKNSIVVGISLEREILKLRITTRTNKMFEDGLIEETKILFKEYGSDTSAFLTPSYKAISEYINGNLTLEDTVHRVVQSDLHLAKRQRTWFKRNKDIEWFDNSDLLIQKAVEFANAFNYN